MDGGDKVINMPIQIALSCKLEIEYNSKKGKRKSRQIHVGNKADRNGSRERSRRNVKLKINQNKE